MTITTKYDINQEVFIIEKGEIFKGRVNKIMPKIKGNGDMFIETYTEIFYDIDCYGKYYRDEIEKNIFETKREAICEMVKQSGYEIPEDALIEI